ncbi:hypothetical protein [Aureispira sp. CCB-QB1]|uniref:hypothetical protein n=1 Tax=Aureispira sp. CCB-QB1 TaxID=1313421 RepID=UPI000697950E|nr:hypothetical protein [Aureispira sp. CCB-QB1]
MKERANTDLHLKQYPFLTQEFFTDPKLLLDILNMLIESPRNQERIVYGHDGHVVSFDIEDNEDNRILLSGLKSSVISDCDKLKVFNKAELEHDVKGIELVGLLYIHIQTYSHEHWIYYDEYEVEFYQSKET